VRRHAGIGAASIGIGLAFLTLNCSGCDGEGSAGGADPAGATDPTEALRADRRIAGLFGECPRNGFYDRDLSDIVPVLIEKLERARPEPMKRAKEELGLVEERAFPALANAFHAYYSDPMRSPFLENTVDALAFNPTDEAHALLLEALQHPQESVRGKALDGLVRRARPHAFDVLVGRMPIETLEMRRRTLGALATADRPRAERLFLELLENDEQRELWITAVQFLGSLEDLALAPRCAALIPILEPIFAVQLAAGAARGGVDSGLEYLRAELVHENAQRRLGAAAALERGGFPDELGPALLADGVVDVRALAAEALANAELLTDERRTWLRSALSDPSPVVQTIALRGLCEHGDPEGLARALAQLEGEPHLLQAALQALREPLASDPELARAVLERLLQRHALEEHRPIQARAASFKAIGQVPLRAAAEFLRDLGVEASGEHIESLRAHDWLMIQAANSGVEGRAFLAGELRTETDPLRRIDLIDALGSYRDDLARTELLAHVERPIAPLERLYAASVLIKIGPSWEVAPRLKRVAFALQGPDEIEARVALQCLLWTWY
jgi:hypothetical protein